MLAILSVVLYACNKKTTEETFDSAAQAVIDNDSIVKFLQSHYFDTAIDSIKTIDNGQTSLYKDTKLKTMDITENDIDYKLYVYVNRVGDDPKEKGFPTIMDSIFATYDLKYIETTAKLEDVRTIKSGTWFGQVQSYVKGRLYGFTNFKGGENVSTDGEPINYTGGGKGILFIPSGLGYANTTGLSVPANSCLVYYINLWDIIPNTDHDNDGIPSINEDPNGDGNPLNDDTDQDGALNFLDADDDNDGQLTKNEDANGDGNPRNDFSDPNNPTLADYLNPLK
ncbi:peptidylprolyl isomerase [Tenacibaculum sp. UWU-22]|uniref:peptidylprolyl isomerase n=1 Tax=Tenacibaculum sp. UWU-22 TaxID=3234187 RepID=UPI0034DB0B77